MYKVWVRQIREKSLPELNDEFAKLMGLENLDALKEAIRKDIFKYRTDQSQDAMKNEIFDKLLKLVDFSLPQGLIEKQTHRLVEQARNQYARMGASESQFEKEKHQIEETAAKKAPEQVKLYFILEKIAELENLSEDEALLEKRIEDLAEESGRPAEEVRGMFEEDLRHSLREKQTVDFLLANATFEEQK